MACARVRGNFFKILQHRRVLRRVKRARADMGKSSLEQPRHRAFVVMGAEVVFDPRRQINPPPPHHPVYLGIGTALHNRRQALQLRRRQLHRRPGQGAVDQAFRPFGVEAVNPVAQGLAVHAAKTGRRRAAVTFVNRRNRQQTTNLTTIPRPRRNSPHRCRVEIITKSDRCHDKPPRCRILGQYDHLEPHNRDPLIQNILRTYIPTGGVFRISRKPFTVLSAATSDREV